MAWGINTAAVDDLVYMKGVRASGEGNSTEWEKRRAVESIAHHATDVEDMVELLDMLGLRDKAVDMAKTAARRKGAA